MPIAKIENMINETETVDTGSANTTPKGRRRGNKNMKSAEKTVTTPNNVTPNNGTINGDNTETTPKSKRNKNRKMQNNTDNNASENTTSENEISVNESSPKNKNKKKKNKKQKQQNANNNSQTEGENAQTNQGKKRNNEGNDLSTENKKKKLNSGAPAFVRAPTPDPKDLSYENSFVRLSTSGRPVDLKKHLMEILKNSDEAVFFTDMALNVKSSKIEEIKKLVLKAEESDTGKIMMKLSTGSIKKKRTVVVPNSTDAEEVRKFFGAETITKTNKSGGRNMLYTMEFASEAAADNSNSMVFKIGNINVFCRKYYHTVQKNGVLFGSPKKADEELKANASDEVTVKQEEEEED